MDIESVCIKEEEFVAEGTNLSGRHGDPLNSEKVMEIFSMIIKKEELTMEETNYSCIEEEAFCSEEETFGESYVRYEPPKKLFAGDTGYFSTDTEPECNLIENPSPSLSFQPWSGSLNFSIKFDSTKLASTKWCYSERLEKLFLMPSVAVPVQVFVSKWEQAYINLTPVYTTSQDYSETVVRCHNHSHADEARDLPEALHIIQIDGKDAHYKREGGRYSVEVPLGSPAPGEDHKIILIKCGCWNACVGGPSRRPYCIIFTLFSRGCEIGRQVLNIKACQCPNRDMPIEEQKSLKADLKIKMKSGKRKETFGESFGRNGPPKKLFAGDSGYSSTDTEPECNLIDNPSPSLSFQSWSGSLNFSIKFDSNELTRTKWCYSEHLKKLFLMPSVAVPVQVSVSKWEQAYINLTPVYTKSQHCSETVVRCHNHSHADEARDLPEALHIIQIDAKDAHYKREGGRYSVEVPLGSPAPGEDHKIILIKCGCWNTCVGGPSRRPYCVIFTLFSRGCEIGRQVLNFKSCQCPNRDMPIEEQKSLNADLKIKLKSGQKMMSSIMKDLIDSSEINRAKNVKMELAEQKCEQIDVPLEIVSEVKRYINALMAERHVKKNGGLNLPFNDV